jgi:DNA end-binding protein Ku
MPRAIWNGTISFGLVSVPVKLFSATQDKSIHFHEFEAGTGERIRHKRVAQDSGDEVAYDDIVKGYEVRKGDYVMVTPEELEAVEPGRSRSIEIEDFVDLDEIDPIYFQTTYYLAPANDEASKPFALLRSAMEDANRVGIARFVMRSKQYLAAVRATEDLLLLETMYFADEVRDIADLDSVGATVSASRVGKREKAAAAQLIDSLSSAWEPERYQDTYRERVLDLVKAKAKGEDIVTEKEEPQADVIDLMAALEASVRDARQQRSGGSKSRGGSKSSGSKSSGSKSGDRAKSGGRKAGTGSGAGDLASMSKEDLYEEAQKRGISGRSKMSRDELIGALEEAS